jgi:hypothetical protein
VRSAAMKSDSVSGSVFQAMLGFTRHGLVPILRHSNDRRPEQC